MGSLVIAKARAVLPLAALLAVAITVSFATWREDVSWTPDGLFYEAQAREVRGQDAEAARKAVFEGKLGRSLHDNHGRITDPEWREFAAPFFRRRWVVPALAAAAQPMFGERSLLAVSLLGYCAAGVLVFALLRRRFPVLPSFVVASTCLLLGPVREWSFHPLTDSWALALMAASLLAATLALDHGRRWLPAWIVTLATLSLTRDAALVVALGAVFLALLERSRRTIELAAAGLAAALPAALLLGAPLRETMAFTFSGNDVPEDSSWDFVIGRYWPRLSQMVDSWLPLPGQRPMALVVAAALLLLLLHPRSRLGVRARLLSVAAALAAVVVVLVSEVVRELPIHSQLVPFGLVVGLGTLLLAWPAPRDPILTLARGGALAACAYVGLLPQFSSFRLELVFLPFAALGLARAFTMVGSWDSQTQGVDVFQAGIRNGRLSSGALLLDDPGPHALPIGLPVRQETLKPLPGDAVGNPNDGLTRRFGGVPTSPKVDKKVDEEAGVADSDEHD